MDFFKSIERSDKPNSQGRFEITQNKIWFIGFFPKQNSSKMLEVERKNNQIYFHVILP